MEKVIHFVNYRRQNSSKLKERYENFANTLTNTVKPRILAGRNYKPVWSIRRKFGKEKLILVARYTGLEYKPVNITAILI